MRRTYLKLHGINGWQRIASYLLFEMDGTYIYMPCHMIQLNEHDAKVKVPSNPHESCKFKGKKRFVISP